MKILLIAILILTLVGCKTNSTKRQAPTPFTTSEKTIKLQGCVDLHKAVKEWNELNPTKEPRIADC